MALARAAAVASQANYWPGFVDMLSTLLLVVTFLMSLFMLTNYFVYHADERQGHHAVAAEPPALASSPSFSRSSAPRRSRSRTSLAALQATLVDKDKENAAPYRPARRCRRQDARRRGPRPTRSAASSTQQKKITNEALAKVEMLNQQLAALRLQLASLQEALDASEAKDKDSQAKIADLGQRLNVALAKKVQELARYRSDFFGKLQEVLGARADFQVVGDRFVFPSDVLFDFRLRRAEAGGHAQLDKLADALKELETKIPPRHRLGDAGRRPYRHPADRHGELPVELGAVERARDLRGALSDARGVPPNRLVAAGFGEFQPIDPGDQRRGSGQEPPHRAQAHRALTLLSLRPLASPVRLDAWRQCYVISSR